MDKYVLFFLNLWIHALSERVIDLGNSLNSDSFNQILPGHPKNNKKAPYPNTL